jgi:hypothetical protein
MVVGLPELLWSSVPCILSSSLLDALFLLALLSDDSFCFFSGPLLMESLEFSSL